MPDILPETAASGMGWNETWQFAYYTGEVFIRVY
jgi:hypothetical protein